jgi:hypothetical protein
MNVMMPETRTDVLQRVGVVFNSKKKNTEAAIIAIVPIKNVKAT